ncbi:hypothetical protein [Streptomyces sp. NBC_01483]|uniref:hypothetical protein n=1 Tax=Streptomyces sp. NBC_01483 TaxID=2903883 RepID=UPI002E30D1CD|nr:hypothetical protein [Streptomyces sp. NBC_01483]
MHPPRHVRGAPADDGDTVVRHTTVRIARPGMLILRHRGRHRAPHRRPGLRAAVADRRLPRVGIEPPECRATHETLAAATDAEVADVLEDEREKERQQDVRDIPG